MISLARCRLPLLLAFPLLCFAQEKPSYDIYRTAKPIMIDARLDEAAWQAAVPVGDFHFNWVERRRKGADRRQDPLGRRESLHRLLLPRQEYRRQCHAAPRPRLSRRLRRGLHQPEP